MVDVFISYSRADLEIVSRLAAAIEAEGYRVWWDKELPPHLSYGDVITEKIGDAKAVIGLFINDDEEGYPPAPSPAPVAEAGPDTGQADPSASNLERVFITLRARASSSTARWQRPHRRPCQSCSQPRLTMADIETFGPATLRIARNEIYARKGRRFKNADMARHFSQFAWYRPIADEVALTAVEQPNVALLQEAERRYGQ
jgi:hypothetical protein